MPQRFEDQEIPWADSGIKPHAVGANGFTSGLTQNARLVYDALRDAVRNDSTHMVDEVVVNVGTLKEKPVPPVISDEALDLGNGLDEPRMDCRLGNEHLGLRTIDASPISDEQIPRGESLAQVDWHGTGRQIEPGQIPDRTVLRDFASPEEGVYGPEFASEGYVMDAMQHALLRMLTRLMTIESMTTLSKKDFRQWQHFVNATEDTLREMTADLGEQFSDFPPTVRQHVGHQRANRPVNELAMVPLRDYITSLYFLSRDVALFLEQKSVERHQAGFADRARRILEGLSASFRNLVRRRGARE